MASMRNSAVVLLLLLSLLFIASEEMVGVEGRTCSTPSSNYKGPCFRDSNCASVCNGEGYPRGDCQGLRRRCMCQRPC